MKDRPRAHYCSKGLCALYSDLVRCYRCPVHRNSGAIASRDHFDAEKRTVAFSICVRDIPAAEAVLPIHDSVRRMC